MQTDQLYGGPGSDPRNDRVGGSRHATHLEQQADADARAPWKCPACGETNEGRKLSEGCTHCGSGGGARHVGVDPIAKPQRKLAVPAYDVRDDAASAFLRWFHHVGAKAGIFEAFQAGWLAAAVTHPVTGEEETDGDALVGGDRRSAAEPRDPAPATAATPAATADSTAPGGVAARPAGPAGGPLPDDGTGEIPAAWDAERALDRTILAALIVLQEQVYSQQPEEASTGEWMTAEALTETIARIKRDLNGPYA